jgi:hypothetical protein
VKNPADPKAERQATANTAAFLNWLRAVHGQVPVPCGPPGQALRRWAATDPAGAARLIRLFAGDGFVSARLAAGLLLEADLRPDDRILVLGPDPDWLPLALLVTQGLAPNAEAATVLICAEPPATLPRGIRRMILTGGLTPVPLTQATVSRSADWTYPSESSAD